MTSPTCIFRYQYCNGAKCNSLCKNVSKYCHKHANKNDETFEFMEDILHDKKIVNISDMYSIFQYIYQLDITSDKKDIFLKIMSYLMSRMAIISMIYAVVYFDATKYKKKAAISYLYDLFCNTHSMSKSYDKEVIKIQKFLRRHLIRKIRACDEMVSENTEDPFTFDTISEIPDEYKFGYTDSKGHVYIFNAVEFEYFIRQQGAWNPYTKEDLPDHVIRRLYILINHHKLLLKDENDCKWQTALQAYTEVSQVMEKAGFYTSVEWFTKLSYTDCKSIVHMYRVVCKNITGGNMYFPTAFEFNQNTYVYDLCKEIINLFKDSDDHYILCCNFIKTLAMYNKDFYNNMPSWLFNMDVPSVPRLPESNLMIMYVQHMMNDIDDLLYEQSVNNRHYDNLSQYRIFYERL